MDCYKLTQAYYSRFLGEENIIEKTDAPICFLYSEERNLIQQGYSAQFDLWVLNTAETIFVSYGKGAEERIGDLKQRLLPHMTAIEISHIINSIYKKKPGCRNQIFLFRQPGKNIPCSRSNIKGL